MKRLLLPLHPKYHFLLLATLFIIVIAGATGLTTSCGTSGSMSAPSVPTFSGNTSVTVVLTSTANDQLSEFGLNFTTITLTSQSGKTVTLLSEPQNSSLGAEVMHVNGGIDPLLTVSVPQGIYASATIQLGGGAAFTCVTQTPPTSQNSGSLDISTYDYGFVPNNMVSVNLPSPITITGDSMGLLLDILVSQSATYSTCYRPNAISTFSITPTFTITAITLSPDATGPANGKAAGLNGEISAVGTAGSFTLTLAEAPRNLPISSNTNTVYQGVSGFSALAVGTFVNMDGIIQSDGSLLATRIAVEDPSAVDVLIGPVLQVTPTQPVVNQPAAEFFNQQSQGKDPIASGLPYSISDSTFQVSGELNNLQGLPFVASFNGTNMIAGQKVYVSSTTISLFGGVPWAPATTITLLPQTIDGTVFGSSTSGAFTVYEVSLAPYDLFPTLAVQPGQTTLLSNPSQVEVYVDNNTQQLNTQPLAAGSTVRFYGLVFNDNGTLRMDCEQVNDGVAFTAPSSASQLSHMEKAAVEVTHRGSAGRLQQTIDVITRQPQP